MADGVLSDDDDDADRSDASGEVDSWLKEAAHAPSVEPVLVGERLGRYQLREVVGRGGMGVVYLAEDEQLGRLVALKVLSADRTSDPERRRRFVREARFTAKLAHPSIATVYDAGEDGTRAFIVMEYVRGRTLRAALEEGPLPHTEVLRIGRAIAEGLAAAHAAKIIHRDVKPDNVILGEDGIVKILDFGVAKTSSGPLDATATSTLDTREGRLVGTPSYMSPEQAKGSPIDERTDVFALGVTLYEMTTGKRPFVGKTALDVFVAIDRDAPAPVRTIAPSTPVAFDRLIRRCLEKDPAARFASAADVLRALDELPARRRSRAGAFGALAFGAVLLMLVLTRLGGGGAAPNALEPPIVPAEPAPTMTPAAPIAPSLAIDPAAAVDAAAYPAPPPRPSAPPNRAPKAAPAGSPGPLDEAK